MIRKMPFDFVDEAVVAGPPDAYIAHVPANIASKEELLRALYESLQLPGYFGFNWDALSDCLRDFHWLDPRTVVLVHADLPQIPPSERRTYLEILAKSIDSWQPEDDHDFRVVFPSSVQAEVTAVLTTM
jgi:RNAse (barnase) inhibitor barstar